MKIIIISCIILVPYYHFLNTRVTVSSIKYSNRTHTALTQLINHTLNCRYRDNQHSGYNRSEITNCSTHGRFSLHWPIETAVTYLDHPKRGPNTKGQICQLK